MYKSLINVNVTDIDLDWTDPYSQLHGKLGGKSAIITYQTVCLLTFTVLGIGMVLFERFGEDSRKRGLGNQVYLFYKKIIHLGGYPFRFADISAILDCPNPFFMDLHTSYHLQNGNTTNPRFAKFHHCLPWILFHFYAGLCPSGIFPTEISGRRGDEASAANPG